MNGGCPPMLGGHGDGAPDQNARVKKPRTPAPSVRASRAGTPGRAAGRQGGFTLIEVMIALIVLVLGVLGAAAMTLNALKDNKQSGLRSQASALAYEVSDLMRMSGPTQELVFTGGAPTSSASCWTTGCSPASMAQNDYYEWNQKLAGTGAVLPNATAKICRDVANLTSTAAGYATCDGLATSPLVVKMKWDEKNNNARDASSPTAVTVAYLVVPIQPY
jgi:type IV pilus assembly protein PilV